MNADTGDRVGAVIVAAGVSSRMGGRDKLAAVLGGRPVLAWSLETCARCPEITAIALVVHPDRRAWATQIIRVGNWHTPITVCAGGERRQDSVAAGVAALSDVDWVAVHDAARPFADVDLFQRCIAVARKSASCALAAVPVIDTIKRVDGVAVHATLSRENLWSAQTPQVCHRATLQEGLELAAANGWSVTDEAMVMEQLHEPVVVVLSDARNFKLTTPEDLAMARALAEEPASAGGGEHGTGRTLHRPALRHTVPARDSVRHVSAAPPRVGLGYDIHRLAPGRRLVLGGVEVEHELGLEGHSDADVILHAVMDALLGAAALGDIGRHFPPGDPAYLGADSRLLLRQVVGLLAEAGYQPANVDVMVVAQRPRLGPHLPEMRRVIAADLGIDVDGVSIKATTNEHLGPEGHEEGISATAIASITRTAG